MRLRLLLIVGVVLAIVILGIPYMSYSSATDDADTSVVTLDVEVSCAAYAVSPHWLYETSYDDQLRGGYLDYVGDFWGGVAEIGATYPDYPFLHVMIQKGTDTTTRQEWTEAYTYGETLEFSCEYIAEHGDTLKFQVQLYYAQSYGSYVGWTEVVP